MLKKTLVIFLLLFGMFSIQVFADYEYYDLSESENGVVTINYPIESDVRYKVLIKKDDVKYYYDLTSESARFPLQMGLGNYDLAILKNQSGISYARVYEASFAVKTMDENKLFLNSISIIDWHKDNESIKYLDTFFTEKMSDLDKVNKLHVYLTESLSYDGEKFEKIKGAYLPNIDETFETRLGICYDFSSLFAAMLRSQGIPSKMVMGYRADTSVYHAWNEVLIDDEWLIVDLTLDVEYFKKGYHYEMIKDDLFYSKDAEY